MNETRIALPVKGYRWAIPPFTLITYKYLRHTCNICSICSDNNSEPSSSPIQHSTCPLVCMEAYYLPGANRKEKKNIYTVRRLTKNISVFEHFFIAVVRHGTLYQLVFYITYKCNQSITRRFKQPLTPHIHFLHTQLLLLETNKTTAVSFLTL